MLKTSFNRHYKATDPMSALISENYRTIHVMTRFGIKIGFNDMTVDDVCRDAGVDTATFLAVVNFMQDGVNSIDPSVKVSVGALLHYLKQSHIYFLEYSLPSIRRKLLDGINLRDTDVSFLILKLFDEYYSEVRRHMEYEEHNVFPYVESLLAGTPHTNFTISTYSDHHEQVGVHLHELKKILIKYCPKDAPALLMNDVLYDIYRCEDELNSHCLVEDRIFVPEIKRIESHE